MNSSQQAQLVKALHPGQLDVERIAEQIAQCKNLDELRDIRDKARAIEAYQRACNAALQTQNDAIEIRLRAERRIGVILTEVIPHDGGRPRKQSRDVTVSLADLNVTKMQSSRSQKLAAVPAEVFEQHVTATKARGEKLTTTGTIAAVSFVAGYDGDEWYTPAKYIEAAREVMGGIDLDPASSPIAQDTVRAAHFYTKDDDGLSQPWVGRVWCNPPYSHPLGTDFANKLYSEIEAGHVEAAVFLQNVSTDTRWFHRLAPLCDLCFTDGRISFLTPGGTESKNNRYAQVFFYHGPHPDRFAEVFGDFGLVLTPGRQAA